MKRIQIICYTIFLTVLSHMVSAQSSATMMFMDNVPLRHHLNIAIQPRQNYYLSLPVMGYLHLNVGNNSLALNNVFQANSSGGTSLFFNTRGNKDKFYKALSQTNIFKANMKINLFGFGFRHQNYYFHFGIHQRTENTVVVPRDLMKLALFGTPSINYNTFDLQKLSATSDVFTEFSAGASVAMSQNFQVGGKLKFLYGSNHIGLSNSALKLNASIKEWSLNGKGQLEYAGAGTVAVKGKFEDMSVKFPSNAGAYLPPAGIGVATDLGIVLRPNDKLVLLASLNDIGMIYWSRNTTAVNYESDYRFKGVQVTLNEQNTFQHLMDSIGDAFKNALIVGESQKSFTSSLNTQLNIGAEYSIFDHRLGFGVLSQAYIRQDASYNELTLSVNARPWHWLNVSVSNSLLNGRFRSLGAGVGLQTGFIHWFAAADYLSFNNIPIEIEKNINLWIPYDTESVNFTIGVNLVLDHFSRTKRDRPRGKGYKQAWQPCRCEDDNR